MRDIVRDEHQALEGDRDRLKASLSLRLQHLDDRLGRLTDLLVDGAFDAATFNVRKEKLLMERQGLLGQHQGAESSSPLAELFVEFERNNRELLRYETLLNDEKRELIEIICSNFSVKGKNAVFALRSPYREIAEIENFEGCAHDRGNVRVKRIFDSLKNAAENGTRLRRPRT